MRHLTPEIVVWIHGQVISFSGGLSGGGQRGPHYEGAEAAVHAVENSYYEDVFELAAAYAVYIVQGHVFADGNKRTATVAMDTFLKMNGESLKIDVKRIAVMTIELQMRARAGESTGDLVGWVAGQLQGRR